MLSRVGSWNSWINIVAAGSVVGGGATVRGSSTRSSWGVGLLPHGSDRVPFADRGLSSYVGVVRLVSENSDRVPFDSPQACERRGYVLTTSLRGDPTSKEMFSNVELHLMNRHGRAAWVSAVLEGSVFVAKRVVGEQLASSQALRGQLGCGRETLDDAGRETLDDAASNSVGGVGHAPIDVSGGLPSPREDWRNSEPEGRLLAAPSEETLALPSPAPDFFDQPEAWWDWWARYFFDSSSLPGQQDSPIGGGSSSSSSSSSSSTAPPPPPSTNSSTNSRMSRVHLAIAVVSTFGLPPNQVDVVAQMLAETGFRFPVTAEEAKRNGSLREGERVAVLEEVEEGGKNGVGAYDCQDSEKCLSGG